MNVIFVNVIFSSRKEKRTDPNQLDQELLNSVKGRELMEMLEKALKESGPADLEEDAKCVWRMSTKGLKQGI